MSRILSTGGVCHQPYPPTPRSRHHPWADIPQEQTPPRGHTPPLEQTTPGRHPPGADTPSRSSACWEIRATSERYASCWNAFLFKIDLSCFDLCYLGLFLDLIIVMIFTERINNYNGILNENALNHFKSKIYVFNVR